MSTTYTQPATQDDRGMLGIILMMMMGRLQYVSVDTEEFKRVKYVKNSRL